MTSLLSMPSLLAVAGSTVSFYLLSSLNAWLFGALAYDDGVHWLYLPSGLRLGLVLMFGGAGAAGVVFGSFLEGMGKFPSVELTLAASAISGLAPWLAHRLCSKVLWLRDDLSNLTAARLAQMALIFAVMSALLHQVLYVSTGLSDSLLEGTAVMALGDFLGTLVVLYGLKVGLSILQKRRPL